MAGVIATLEIWGQLFPGAYVHLDGFSCDLNAVTPTCPDGVVNVAKRYYFSKARFDANPNDYVTPAIDPMGPIVLPYVRNSDPVNSAIVQLKEWLPDAVEA